MKKTSRLFLAFATCAALIGVAHANPVATAAPVAGTVASTASAVANASANVPDAEKHAKAIFEFAQKKLAEPAETDFQKWVVDAWTLAARHCGRQAGVAIPEQLGQPLKTSAAWTSPHHGACQQLAAATVTPTAPVCTKVSSVEPPYGMPYAGLYNNYLFMDGAVGGKIPAGEVEQSVMVQCLLGANVHTAPQFYKGKAKLNVGTSAEAQIAEAGAVHKLIAADATIQIPGLDGKPLTARILSKN